LKSKLILGTVQFGLNYGINNNKGKPNFNEVKSIFDYAYNNNINFLDTAEAYGNSHEIIGNYHEASGNKFHVISKYCSARLDLPKNISDRINHHLKILNVNNLYCYMFHNYDDFKNYFNLFKLELLELKNKGIVKKIGVSLHSNHNINDVLENKEIDLIQLPYNLLDNKSKREKIFLKAKEKGVEIHTRSTFLQGLFFKDLNDKNRIVQQLKAELGWLKNLLLEYNCSIEQLAISYCFMNKKIDNIILGIDSLDHLNINLQAAKFNLTNELLEKIHEIKISNVNILNPSLWN